MVTFEGVESIKTGGASNHIAEDDESIESEDVVVERDEVKEVENLAREETWKVEIWRRIVIIMVRTSCGTRQERRRYLTLDLTACCLGKSRHLHLICLLGSREC